MQEMKRHNHMMSIKEAAEYLHVSQQLVNKLIKDKRLKASKVGDIWRIRGLDIEKYLEDSSNQ